MKRAVVTGIICALLVAGVAWATQTWRDNESMGGFSLTDPTHAGGGPLCVQYDNTGKLTSAGAPCGAGLGGSAGVSSVTGTPLRVSTSPTTAPSSSSISIGGYYTGAGATSGETNVRTSGQLTYSAAWTRIRTVSTKGGVAELDVHLRAHESGSSVPFGASSGGGLTSTTCWRPPFSTSAVFHALRRSMPPRRLRAKTSASWSPLRTVQPTASGARHRRGIAATPTSGSAGADGGGVGFSYTTSTNTENVNFRRAERRVGERSGRLQLR